MKYIIISKDKLKPLSSKIICDIHCIHVQISDFKDVVKEFGEAISDRSWISKMGGLEKIALQSNADKTIEKIVTDVLSKVKNKVTIDIGEYLVSYSSQNALENLFSHKKIPLAELLKEKVSGNPGFDFHTICSDNYLIFGEAKFSLKSSPHGKALRQIDQFIDHKDNGELLWLKPFLEDATISNILNGFKGYTAGFSFNGQDIVSVFNAALNMRNMKKLKKHKKLFLIAVQIC